MTPSTSGSHRATPIGDGASLADRITLRPYRGSIEHAEMRRVANLVRAANGDRPIGSVAETDAHYARFDQDALPLDVALAELDGRLVAYARATLEWLSTGEGEIGGILAVDPAFKGRGIEERLVQHVMRRARQQVAGARSGTSLYVRFFLTAAEAPTRAAVEAAGFRPVRASAEMVRPSLDDIPDIPMPEGFEIRPIAAGDEAMIRRVWDADGRAFADTWGHEAPTERAYLSWRRSPAFDPTLWRVAFHGDAIAGQILNYLGEPDADGVVTGFTEAISVQPEWRRRGLARALLAASLRAVREAGATRAGLGVDSMNPNQAQTLYASMGYRVVGEGLSYELGPFPAGSDGPANVVGAGS